MKKHNNNMDLVRLIAAWLVLYGHSFVFLGLRESEPLFLSCLSLGPLGVFIFFTISGYLVTESWHRDPHLGRFFVRRSLRIFPGLTVCILLSVMVLVPLLTTLPLRDYLEHQHTRRYLCNIGLYISYHLPGVFETNLLPNAVNGSLWSLPVEFLMYVVVAILGILSRNRWVYVVLALGSASVSYFWAQHANLIAIYAFDLRQVFLCGTYFWFGALFWAFDLKKYLSLSIVVLAFITLLCLEPWHELLRVAFWVLLPIIVLSFGLSYSPVLTWPTRTGDYSYGFYIYAFPIQQTVVYLIGDIHLGPYLIICTGLTLGCAVLSWHLIERRALGLKPGTSSILKDYDNGQGFLVKLVKMLPENIFSWTWARAMKKSDRKVVK